MTQAPTVGAASGAESPGLSLVPATARPQVDDAGAASARAPLRSIGTPVVSGGDARGELRPVWEARSSVVRVRCEGTAPSVVASTQSPYEPGSPAIVRAFLPVTRGVSGCAPATNERGRLPLHATFAGNGAPTTLDFPGVRLSRAQAMCVAEALCAVRMPAFRAMSASVNYEFLIGASP